jgi:hypothetical protein
LKVLIQVRRAVPSWKPISLYARARALFEKALSESSWRVLVALGSGRLLGCATPFLSTCTCSALVFSHSILEEKPCINSKDDPSHSAHARNTQRTTRLHAYRAISCHSYNNTGGDSVSRVCTCPRKCTARILPEQLEADRHRLDAIHSGLRRKVPRHL